MSAYFAFVTCPRCTERTVATGVLPYDAVATTHDCKHCNERFRVTFPSGSAVATVPRSRRMVRMVQVMCLVGLLWIVSMIVVASR